MKDGKLLTPYNGVEKLQIINHAHRAGYEEGPSEGAVDVGKAPLGPLKVTLT
jgi:hypothetical protein